MPRNYLYKCFEKHHVSSSPCCKPIIVKESFDYNTILLQDTKNVLQTLCQFCPKNNRRFKSLRKFVQQGGNLQNRHIQLHERHASRTFWQSEVKNLKLEKITFITVINKMHTRQQVFRGIAAWIVITCYELVLNSSKQSNSA